MTEMVGGEEKNFQQAEGRVKYNWKCYALLRNGLLRHAAERVRNRWVEVNERIRIGCKELFDDYEEKK